jgi:hypothetical protein
MTNLCTCPFQAFVVLGQFLILKKNKDLFIDWIKDSAGANNKQGRDSPIFKNNS